MIKDRIAPEDPVAELRRVLGPHPGADELFDHFDKSKDNTIDRSEFKVVHSFVMQEAEKASRARSQVKLLLWFFGIMFLLDCVLSGVMYVTTTVAIESTKEFHAEGPALIDKQGMALSTPIMTWRLGLFGLCNTTFDGLTNLETMRFWAGDVPSVYRIGGFQIFQQETVREHAG